MASRIAKYWLQSVRTMGTAAAEASPSPSTVKTKFRLRGELAPVYVELGMILVALSLGVYTVQEQLRFSPSVLLNKRRRAAVPEVEEPDRVAGEVDGYINHSIFRKIAHMQDFDAIRSGISDPSRAGDPPCMAPRPRVESLKSVGVEVRPPPTAT